jgi:hypothetical protein
MGDGAPARSPVEVAMIREKEGGRCTVFAVPLQIPLEVFDGGCDRC